MVVEVSTKHANKLCFIKLGLLDGSHGWNTVFGGYGEGRIDRGSCALVALFGELEGFLDFVGIKILDGLDHVLDLKLV